MIRGHLKDMLLRLHPVYVLQTTHTHRVNDPHRPHTQRCPTDYTQSTTDLYYLLDTVPPI